ncbi:MAG: efflux RND transporter permease subunit [Gammaproteobacteria bacterium]
MLSVLVRFSVRYYGIVIALAILLLSYGVYRLSNAGLDIFPEFSPKQVIVQTESSGYSAEQVEILVTQPIENVLSGLIGLKYLRSESIQGLSIVTATFEEDTDIYLNRQMVSERLSSVGSSLPEGIGTPVPVPLASSSATILTIGVRSDSLDMMDLRSIVDWTIVPQILSVNGVADVNVFGGEIKQLQIQILPEKLKQFGLGIKEVVDAASQSTAIKGAGFIENDNQRFTIQTSSESVRAEDIAKVVVKRESGFSIQLSDVANVLVAPAPRIGAGAIMGKPAIVMMIIGQFGANTLNVSNAVEAVLEDLDLVLSQQGVTFYTHLFRPSDYIERSLDNIVEHLLIGGAFVLIVLFIFLFNIRTAFISALAIPLSLISAALVLLESGVNLNIMVLGGLAIALGEVVDDAIIDTENIFRRLRENKFAAVQKPVADIVYEASMEVRGSVVYASFIVALVFVPLLTLSGVAGRLFSPLGVSYILAILTSLFVALTVTPALCYLLLGNSKLPDRDPPLIRLIHPIYEWFLRLSTRLPTLTIGTAMLVCVAGIAIIPSLGSRFLPELREGHYIVHTTAMPGTSLEQSIQAGNRLTEAFLEIPGVRSVSQWAGRAERSADTYGSHYSEFEVDLEPLSGKEQQAVIDSLREALKEFPGLLFEANTFLIERVDETISGYTSPIVINLYGNELGFLDQKAQAVMEIVRRIEGATDVQMRSTHGTPVLQVKLKHDRLNSLGLRPVEVMDAIQIAYEGRVVGKSYQGNQIIDVSVYVDGSLQQKPEDLGKLPLKTAEGAIIPLSNVATILQTAGRYNILHQGAQRIQTVTCNVQNRDLDNFMHELKSKVLAGIEFEAGAYPEFTGAAIEQANAREDLILHSLVAGIGVLILIYMAVGRVRDVVIMLLNLPFSLVGGVVAVLLTGATLSVGSIVGFVTLFGITVRNSIMLVSHYRHLVEVEGRDWNIDTLVKGAKERLPSILMTALVTALAMLPIAIDSDNPGREIMGPMAAIIIGGMVSSTILNLLILPSVIFHFGRFKS